MRRIVNVIKETTRLNRKSSGSFKGTLKTKLSMFILLSCLIPFFFKDVGENIPTMSTSYFLAAKAFAKELILVQGAPGVGCGSSKKNDILMELLGRLVKGGTKIPCE